MQSGKFKMQGFSVQTASNTSKEKVLPLSLGWIPVLYWQDPVFSIKDIFNKGLFI